MYVANTSIILIAACRGLQVPPPPPQSHSLPSGITLNDNTTIVSN